MLLSFLLGVIIVPIVEEIVFRGLYTQKKIFIWVYGIGVFSYILLTKTYLVSIPVFLVHLWIIGQQKKGVNRYVFLGYFINSLLFSVMHINITKEFEVLILLQTGVRLGIGMILIWLVLNFNLFVSIVVHALHNFIIFLLQFMVFYSNINPLVDNNVNIDNYKLEWQVNITLFTSKKISLINDTLKCHNCTFLEFMELQKINISVNDTVYLNALYKNKKYDIVLIKTREVSDEIREKQMIELLLKAKVLNKK